MKPASASRAIPASVRGLAQPDAGGRLVRSPLASAGGALAGILALVMFVGAPAAAEAGAGRLGLIGRVSRPATGAGSRVPIGRTVGPALGDVVCPACDPIDSLDAENFARPTRIDNRWLPLVPGTQLILNGVQNRGGTPLPHSVIFTVTNLVKNLSGIPCVVVWDRDINEGDLRESELAFFAQDDDGNVWNLGEYPEEYDHGILLGAENTWINGVENARAGVTVQDRVRLGAGYLQAIAPENDFWDCGMAFAKSKKGHEGDHGDDDDGRGRGRTGDDGGDRAQVPPVCGPTGCYKDWLVVREWAPLDGCGDIQVKTYAKHVGVVQVSAINDPEGETLVLGTINHLSPEGLAEADRQALELDTRGYWVNEIYATTEPAHEAPRHHGHDDDAAQIAGNAPATPLLPLHTFMRIGPNPATTTTSFAYGVVQPGAVELSIYDVSGRRVRSLVQETAPAGMYRIDWDTRDDGGRSLAAGMYFARLKTPAQEIGKAIVISR